MDDNRTHLINFIKKESQEKPFVCVEIGVWQGIFSKRILNNINLKELHLIDPWVWEQGSIKKNFYIASTKVAKNQKDMDNIYKSVVKKFEENSKVFVHRNFSIDAVVKFSDHYFDFIYIDGCHDYKNVKQDLNAWFPKVKLGGFITGDDYDWGPQFKYPVKKAVNEFMKNNPIKKISITKGQYILKKCK